MSSLLQHVPALVLGASLPLAVSAPAPTSAGRPPLTLRTLYGLPPTSSLDRERTALVLVDFQREFVDGGLPLPAAAQAVERSLKLLRWARESGVLVVFVRQVAAGPGPLFAPGSAGAEPLPGFEPRDGEWVVTKSAAGGFTRTDLAERLAARRIDRLIVAGFMTHLAVDSTARDAAVLGLRVLVAADATATRTLPAVDGGEPLDHRTLQRAALAVLADRFADVLPVERIVQLPITASPQANPAAGALGASEHTPYESASSIQRTSASPSRSEPRTRNPSRS